MKIAQRDNILDAIAVRRNDFPTTDLDGEIGMFNIESGKYYSLESVSVRIWNIIEKPQSIRNIITILLEEYDVNEECCQEQVIEFVNKLFVENLINLK